MFTGFLNLALSIDAHKPGGGGVEEGIEEGVEEWGRRGGVKEGGGKGEGSLCTPFKRL
jgi:hypothetical protein